MSRCDNPHCDRVEAAALQVAGAWDALRTLAWVEDPEAGVVLQALGDLAPSLAEALQILSDTVGDED